ncbi:ankyrin repeat-containing domain protein [Sphaerosporella brunnea]|uniref:protein S-acyltransferase n=1 Tax=Sphaerosporella brunnea TaxID=1250544 RepID=A0A5J5F8Z2_9PEZI|nr:ankyrin repeat-containing domain protein [Sphaerosporella brunnea]
MSPLHCAAKFGRSDIIRQLIQKGPKFELQDCLRRALLHWAAHGGFHDISDLLLRNDARISARDDHGRTPLHLAMIARMDESKTAQKLLRWNADKNGVDLDRSTSLHLRVALNKKEVVKVLLNPNFGGTAELESPDVKGRTALHVAAELNHHEIAKLLLEQGSDIKALHERQTALHKAAFEGHQETVQTLLQQGAELHVADAEGSLRWSWQPRTRNSEPLKY